MKNYEKIKSMNVEEMAYTIMCPYGKDSFEGCYDDCIGCTKDWLLKEAE